MNKTFGSEIRLAREILGLQPKQLAELIGVSQSYLNDVEQGRRNPPGYYFTKKVAQVFSFDEDYLNFMAGRWPSDILETRSWVSSSKFEEAYAAFKRELSK